jgi:hypothetical protein
VKILDRLKAFINVDVVSQLREERDRLVTQLDQMVITVEALDASLVHESAINAFLNAQVAELVASNANLKQLRVSADEKVSTLTNIRTRLSEQLDDATAALEETNSRIAILETELRELRDVGRADTTDRQIVLLDSPARTADTPADATAADELVSDSTREAVYQIVGLFFDGRHFWSLSQDDGKSRITAAVRDGAFRDRMKSREVGFFEGDSLRMRLNTVSWQRPNGSVYSKHAVVEVIEVLTPPQQADFAEVEP